MYNLFFKILIVVIVLSTLGILGLKPKMHNKVLIYDSSYTIVENTPETVVETKIPEKEQVVIAQKTISNEVKKEVQTNKVEPKKVSVEKKVTVEPKKEVKQVQKPQTTVTSTKENKVAVKTEPKKTETVKVTQPVKTETTKVSEPKTETVKVQQPKQVQTQTLTEKEEEIAWNIWRSNLQNQIMRDVRLPYIPKGTVFRFTFDVDKYGRISNIKTWSTNPNYTPYAIQFIAPVIRSYQGKDILDFPAGTQRITTKFEGGWRISDSAKYSTPNDYNDIEKVKK